MKSNRKPQIILLSILALSALFPILAMPPTRALATSWCNEFQFSGLGDGVTQGFTEASSFTVPHYAYFHNEGVEPGFQPFPSDASVYWQLQMYNNMSSGSTTVTSTAFTITSDVTGQLSFDVLTGTYPTAGSDGLSTPTEAFTAGVSHTVTYTDVYTMTGFRPIITTFPYTDDGYHFVLTHMTIQGTGTDPFPSNDCIPPTPTPTPTFTPTPIGPGTPIAALPGDQGCALLGPDNAAFNNLPGNWALDGPTGNPTSTTTGLALTQGSASLSLQLSRIHKYQIDLKYHLADSLSGDIIQVQLGKTSPITVPVAASADPQTYSIAASQYEPTALAEPNDPYTLKVSEALFPSGNRSLVVDWICVTDATPVPIVGGNSAEVCKACIYHSTGDIIQDALGALQWLWCGISQLWSCVIKVLIANIWGTILTILGSIGQVMVWAGIVVGKFIAWAITSLLTLWHWLGGLLAVMVGVANNSINGAINGFGLPHLVNAILAFLGGVPQFVLDGITFLGSLLSGIINLLSTLLAGIGTVFNIAIYWIGQWFNGVLTALSAIPILFSSLAASFNASAYSVPFYAPACTAPNTLLYFPCLGTYVLDNTVFDGPIYYVLILYVGFVAINTLLWAITQIREALSK